MCVYTHVHLSVPTWVGEHASILTRAPVGVYARAHVPARARVRAFVRVRASARM